MGKKWLLLLGISAFFSGAIGFENIKADSSAQSSKFNTEDVVNNTSQAKSELETTITNQLDNVSTEKITDNTSQSAEKSRINNNQVNDTTVLQKDTASTNMSSALVENNESTVQYKKETSNISRERNSLSVNDGWYQDYLGYRYVKKDGTLMTSKDAHSNGWNYVNGTPYIFSSMGYLQTNDLVKVKGKYYYLDSNGHYLKNRWHNYLNTYYYHKADGSVMTSEDAYSNGWNYVGGTPYVFSSMGYLQTNDLVKVKGKYYYLDSNGHYLKNRWHNYLGVYYYHKADGSAMTAEDAHSNGWNYVGGTPYIFNSMGYLQTSDLVKVKGKYYYLDNDGHYLSNTWKDTFLGDYYLTSDGSAVTLSKGWYYIGGQAYLFDDTGSVYKDTKITYKGRTYRFDQYGHYYKNKPYREWGANEFYGPDGALVV